MNRRPLDAGRIGCDFFPFRLLRRRFCWRQTLMIFLLKARTRLVVPPIHVEQPLWLIDFEEKVL
jgi:hypothetical protein